MAKDSAASWTTQDEVDLLNFLAEHASAAGDGGNFKSATFQAATAVLNQNPVKGSVKTSKACANKYGAVSVVVSAEIWLTFHSQCRRVFRAIQAIKNKSGWTWSDDTGASITPDMEDAWEAFIKIYKEAKPFKNHSWIHLEAMSTVMPTTLNGAHVFFPSQGLSGVNSFPNGDEDMLLYAADTQDNADAHLFNAAPAVAILPVKVSRSHHFYD